MKITRVLTYNIDENYVRDFFDENWWENSAYVDTDEFDYFIDSLRDESYDGEEIIYDKGVQEKMTQIWQEECDNYHRETTEEEQEETEEKILKDIQYYKDVLEYYKDKIAFLEDRIKNMKGE